MTRKSAVLLAVAVFALLLSVGCGKKEEAATTAVPTKSMTPREMYEQRLKDPTVSEGEKDQLRKALQSMPPASSGQ